MSVYASTMLISVLGVSVLTGLTFGPTDQSRQIAVLFPPWQNDGFGRAAATGLAIIDLHWQGHVVILDTGGDPTALAHLKSQGFWLLDASGTVTCGNPIERT
ncbi:hypothetical protein [Rhodobacter ferrooxidans]|uniref:hypothetical protein n=1 Tax=Rhodobacter ferrooxidans TaxID=371731 RepID=UPI0005941049|nr:hypothetical protein [Rhodobacter sp. SW2]